MNPLRNFRHRMGGTSIGCLWSTKGCLWKYWVFAGCFGSFSRVPGCFFWGGLTPQTQTPSFSRFNREQRPWMHNFDMEEIGEI
jgi:hypothetical protein